MTAPVRHGRRHGGVLWPFLPGVLIGMVVGVVIFARIAEALR